MTGFLELAEELALWTTQNCQPFEPTFTAHVLSATRYASLLAMLTLYVAGIRYGELYLLLFGVGSTINWALNLLTRAIVHDQTLVVPTCVDVYNTSGNWPSYQSQEASFIVAFIASYCVTYRVRAHPLSFFLLMAYFVAVVAGDLLLNYHTKSQIVGAVVEGALFGELLHLYLRVAVLPYAPWLLSTQLARYMQYQETLCAPQDKDE